MKFVVDNNYATSAASGVSTKPSRLLVLAFTKLYEAFVLCIGQHQTIWTLKEAPGIATNLFQVHVRCWWRHEYSSSDIIRFTTQIDLHGNKDKDRRCHARTCPCMAFFVFFLFLSHSLSFLLSLILSLRSFLSKFVKETSFGWHNLSHHSGLSVNPTSPADFCISHHFTQFCVCTSFHLGKFFLPQRTFFAFEISIWISVKLCDETNSELETLAKTATEDTHASQDLMHWKQYWEAFP